MTETWKYQLRLVIADAVSPSVRENASDEALKPLFDTLSRHDAVVKCQYDAFADFVAEMEREGETDIVALQMDQGHDRQSAEESRST